MVDSGTGQARSASSRPVDADLDQLVPARQRRGLRRPPAAAELAGQVGHDHVGPGQRDPAVGGQAVVGDAAGAARAGRPR